jgi:putative transcriptional regulator
MSGRRFCQVALEVNYQTIGYLDLALRAAEYFGLPVEAVFSRLPLTPMSQQLYPGKS